MRCNRNTRRLWLAGLPLNILDLIVLDGHKMVFFCFGAYKLIEKFFFICPFVMLCVILWTLLRFGGV